MPDTSTILVAGIVLEPVLGPPFQPVELQPGKPYTIGRLPECEIQLPEAEKTVSRRHCQFEQTHDSWIIVDLGSRHGTLLNDQTLTAHQPYPLRLGDFIRVGPWVFRVQAPGARALGTMTMDDTRSGARLVAVPASRRDGIDRRRLELLLQVSKRIQTATDEAALAEAVLDALVEGTGYPRAAIIRPSEGLSFERVDILATRMSAQSVSSFQFSRSLIQAACSGQMVQLRRDDGPVPPMSILASGTVLAMAVPILLDAKAALCLYLDARQDEPPVHEDAGAFCQAIAEMCSLSVASIQRRRLESERLRLTEQMDAAMQIQRQILPLPSGQIGAVAYAMDLRPGRFVAGDLFDVVKLDDRRIAFFIGDVAGKGLPAAILMACTQSFLNASLQHHDDPARAMEAVNRHLVAHAPETKFVSLWVGVLDTRTGVLRYVDAGHGYWLIREPNGQPREMVGRTGGVPLRVDDDAVYSSEQIKVVPGTRIVLYSDGVVEQNGSTEDGTAGEPFGLDRVLAALTPATNPDEDVQMLVRAVQRHARVEILSDDLTVGSIEFRPPAI